jgi:hypothetical protein
MNRDVPVANPVPHPAPTKLNDSPAGRRSLGDWSGPLNTSRSTL